MSGKVDGVVTRERGLELRAIGAGLTRRFTGSQCGTIRPGLTLEDGTLVVTDNYLKVRIPAGLPRNQRVSVRLSEVGSMLVGELQGAPIIIASAFSTRSRSRCGPGRFGDELTARGADVAAAALADRHRDAVFRKDPGESIHAAV